MLLRRRPAPLLRHSPILPWPLRTVGRHTARRRSMRRLLGESDILAYLAIITVRLIELHRVLKPTGSLYLHCDTMVRHYPKVLLDAVFDPRNFVNEVIWKRSTAHNDRAQGAKHYV